MAPNAPIHIIIDDKQYTTTDHAQEAAALLRLAARDPKRYDLFLITKDGVEDHIRDGQIVNLKDGEKFVAREKLHFTIDGQQYTTFDDDQEVSALLRLADIDPANYDLARIVPGGGSQTFGADEIVRIHDGDEFVTAKHVGGVA